MVFRVIKIVGPILAPPPSRLLQDSVHEMSPLRASISSSIRWAAHLPCGVAVTMAGISQHPAPDLVLSGHSSDSGAPPCVTAQSSQSLEMSFLWDQPWPRILSPASSFAGPRTSPHTVDTLKTLPSISIGTQKCSGRVDSISEPLCKLFPLLGMPFPA